MAEQIQTRQFNNPLFREIHKNTWLKKVPKNESKKVRKVKPLTTITLTFVPEKRKSLGYFLHSR